MYQPPELGFDIAFKDDIQTDDRERYYICDNPLPLFDPVYPTNPWTLGGGIQFQFPAGVILPPHGFLLAVNFDPAADPRQLAAFQSRFGLSASVPVFGPYGGKLS